MNSNNQSQNLTGSRLLKLGGKFILRVQLATQLVSSLIGPILGIYFIYITANLSNRQFIQFLISLAISLVFVNILHIIYSMAITKQARLYLDHIFKAQPLPEGSDQISAWNEIITFPRRSIIAQIILIVLFIIFPVILYMSWAGGLNQSQLIYVAIGGSLSILAIIVQSFLFLDAQLTPARCALLPPNPSNQEIRVTLGIHSRQFIMASILLLVAILMVGGVGYQKILSMTSPGSDLAAIFSSYKTQFLVIGIAIFLLGIFLASQLAGSVSKPTREIVRIMDQVKNGDFSGRAQIMTSDDMARLTIRFNQMMDQLQTTQLSLEHQVQERTSTLEQRGKQLQAAAQVAREAASLQDLNFILSRTVNLISEQFGYYHAGIFLLDDSGEFAVLQAASSSGGNNMLARGHRLAVGQQGIVGAAAYDNRPRIAMDVGADREFFNNPDLPMTRSEVALPLTVSDRVIGVLDIQSTEESKFSASDIEVLQILADQVALAIQNARLIAESQDAIQRMEAATAQNLRRTWGEKVHNAKSAYRYTSSGLIPAVQLKPQESMDAMGANYLKIPINLRGQHIGTISLHRKGDTVWSDSDLSLVNEVSAQVGLALENARLVQDTQLRAEREKNLSQMTARIRETLDIDVVLQTAVREIKQSLNLDQAEIRLQIAGQTNKTDQSRQS